jgi:hypothetical protein
MIFRIVSALAIFAACGGWMGCSMSDKDSVRPDPLVTVRQILALHGLEGRSPDNRPEAFRNAEVDPEALGRLFFDYHREDPFLANLYVGFIVGALAVNQHTLQVFEQGLKAEIRAGKVRVSMRFSDGAWRVSLADSIPDGVKARAKMEKLKVAANTPAGR